jgi:outer membrane immunogenic protein
MRRFLLAAMMCGAVSGAQAADLSDLPILRGAFTDGLTSSKVNWAGVYIGGQATHGAADMDFTNSGQDLLAKLLNNVDLEQQFNISKWPLLGKDHASSTGYGGFAGYNFQWSDALIGVELNYTHGKFAGSSSGSQSRVFQFPTDYMSTATAFSSSSMKITDYGSLRVRGGYAIGSFLPYGFVGVAMGQADIDRFAQVSTAYQYVGSQIPAKPNIPRATNSLSDNANSHFTTGFAGGLGVDVMLCAGLFLRAEWEYLRFTSTVDTSINTVRAGLGYKF